MSILSELFLMKDGVNDNTSPWLGFITLVLIFGPMVYPFLCGWSESKTIAEK
jgi:hypothetical protein